MAKKSKTDVVEKFSQRLDDLLLDKKEKGISMDKIAAETGISKSALSKWRKCGDNLKGIPQTDYLRKLADYFQVNVEWLAGTPGAERDQNTTLAATGLSAEAISNLIDINDLLERDIRLSEKDVLSRILGSEAFMKLVFTLKDLLILADTIESTTQLLEEAFSSDTERAADFLDSFDDEAFKMRVDNLTHGRYAVVGSCSKMLDGLCKRPVDEIVDQARTYIDLISIADARATLIEMGKLSEGRNSDGEHQEDRR